MCGKDRDQWRKKRLLCSLLSFGRRESVLTAEVTYLASSRVQRTRGWALLGWESSVFSCPFVSSVLGFLNGPRALGPPVMASR